MPDATQAVENLLTENADLKTQIAQLRAENELLRRQQQELATAFAGPRSHQLPQVDPQHLDASDKVNYIYEGEEGLLFERLVETDQDMIFVKDKYGKFLFINHALAKLYGTTPAEARGKTDDWFSCATPEQIERFRKHDEMVLNGNPPPMPVFEDVTGKDGCVRWYLTRKVRFEWKGQPALLGVATDVTDLRNAMDLVPIIIDCKDSEGNYTLVNRAFLDFFGRDSLAEVQGQTIDNIIPGNQADMVEAAKMVKEADAKILAGESRTQVEVKVFKDGKLRTFRIIKQQLKHSEQGDISILSVAQDVTDDAEELQRVVNFARIGLFRANEEGETTWINPKGREMEGLAPHESPANWKNYLEQTKKEEVLRLWEAFIKQCSNGGGREPARDHYQMEEFFRTREGAYRVFDVLVQATRANDGALTGFVGVFRDITDLKQSELQLQRSLEHVGHDTKNAVHALNHLLDQLRLQADNHYARRLVAAGRTTVRAITYLAERAENPVKPRIDQEEFELWETIDTFAVLSLDHTHAKKVADVWIHESVPRWVYGHRAVLMEVLPNLVTNAANHQGVTQLQIEVTCNPGASPSVPVTIAVEDNGEGLSEERYKSLQDELKKSVEHFETQFSSPLRQEHGKGLRLCQYWLKTIGSKLAIDIGKNGRWNRFSFTIVVEKRQAKELDDDKRGPSLANRGAVLLVEDNPLWRSILAERLIDWGVRCLTVCDRGEEAIRLVEYGVFALVLMDIKLAGKLDGYQTACEIRKRAASLPSCPWLVSISVTENDENNLKLSGFDRSIRKDKLRQAIDLFQVWFPGEAVPVEPLPPAPLMSNTAWFANLHRKQVVELFSGLAVIAALTLTWTTASSATQKVIHDWKQKWLGKADALLDRFEAAKSSPNPCAAIVELVKEVVNALQAEFGPW